MDYTFISVDERMPEIGTWVLATDSIDIIVARWTGSGWEGRHTGHLTGVTHWFPRPNMPGGQ